MNLNHNSAASFYYLLTGEIPTPSLARKFNNDELIEPKQHNHKISDRINEAILKGMEIEPGDRPQSVDEWLNLLKSPSIEAIALNTQKKKKLICDRYQLISSVDVESYLPSIYTKHESIPLIVY